jgi:Integrase core domain
MPSWPAGTSTAAPSSSAPSCVSGASWRASRGVWRHNLTESDPAAGPIPDLVHRDFTAHAPGQKMVGDITYIPTWEGWLFLATVIDCYTKKVIGWAMDDNYKTPLISAAIRMAARNHALEHGAIFHSDRGSNYTSAEFAATLAGLGLRQSVSRTGVCFDCETVLRHPSRSDPCFDWPIECPGIDLSAGSGDASKWRVRAGSDLIGA